MSFSAEKSAVLRQTARFSDRLCFVEKQSQSDDVETQDRMQNQERVRRRMQRIRHNSTKRTWG